MLLNDQSIYEHILRDDVFVDMVGLLECQYPSSIPHGCRSTPCPPPDDPEFPRLKAHYRDFLRENAKHHEVVEFQEPMIRNKVHSTYRLQYLKDVVLARVLDDPIFNVLNSLIIFNQIDIVNYIQNEEYFLREIFSLFIDHPNQGMASMLEEASTIAANDTIDADDGAGVATGETTTEGEAAKKDPETETETKCKEEKRAPALLLLHQFCTMGKNVQLPMRLTLFRSLVDRGILYPVQWALGQNDIKILNTAGEILAMVLDHDAGGVRGHILRQVEEDAKVEKAAAPVANNGDAGEGRDPSRSSTSPTLLAMMSSILTSTEHELSLKSQLADSFRTLMDVPGLDATVRDLVFAVDDKLTIFIIIIGLFLVAHRCLCQL